MSDDAEEDGLPHRVRTSRSATHGRDGPVAGTDLGGVNSSGDDDLMRQFREAGQEGERITQMVKEAHAEFLALVKERGVEQCLWDSVLNYWRTKLQEVPP